jgi:thiamine biosynthesis lipoprotein
MKKSAAILTLSLLATISCSTSRPDSSGGSGASASGTLARYEERRVAMGVQARIVLYADSRARADDAFTGAFARIERLENALSDYRPTSELSRLSESAGGKPREVSADLYAAIERSIEFARSSGGAFDPAVGPLVQLWRQARTDGKPPEAKAIQAALPLSRWEKIELDPAKKTVRLAEAGMRLDLGAIGKGIACDEALAMLRSKGCPSALVEIGGDLSVGDPPPGEKGWTVAAGPRTIQVARQSVSTSGDASQRLELDGVRYSHVVDPRTGMGVTGGVTTTARPPTRCRPRRGCSVPTTAACSSRAWARRSTSTIRG